MTAARLTAVLIAACACLPAPAGARAPGHPAGPGVFTAAVRQGGQSRRIMMHSDTLSQLRLSPYRRALLARLFGPGPVPGRGLRSQLGAAWLSSQWCGDPAGADRPSLTGAPEVKLAYVRAADQPDGFAAAAPLMESDALAASQMVLDASGGRRSVRFDQGSSCGPDRLDIQSVRLPQPLSYYLASDQQGRWTRFSADLSAALGGLRGAGAAPRNVIAYADGFNPFNWSAGQGMLLSDDRPSALNASNRGGLLAVVWGAGGPGFMGGAPAYYRPEVMLHELTHTLGAVQPSAPHSTGAGHCNDEWDTMCYADGGPKSALSYPCSQGHSESSSAYDCGADDYFNPDPAPGSYLASHWNLYSSSFLCPAASCGRAEAPAPSLALSVTPAGARPGDAVTFTAQASGGQLVPGFSWDLDGDGAYERSGTAASVSKLMTVPCRPCRASVQAADTLGRPVTASAEFSVQSPVTANRPPAPAVFAPASADAGESVTLDGSHSSDPDGRVTSYAWDVGADGTLDGTGPKLSWTFRRAGRQEVKLTVTDNSGASASDFADVDVRPLDALAVTFGTLAPRPARSLASTGKLRVPVAVSADAAVTASVSVPGRPRLGRTVRSVRVQGGLAGAQLILAVPMKARRALRSVRGRPRSLAVTVKARTADGRAAASAASLPVS